MGIFDTFFSKKQVLILGHLAVIEFKKIDDPPGPPKEIRLSEDETEKMVTGYGFKMDKTVDIGDYNYLITFQETDFHG